jgi:hypothetical protein
VEAVRVRSVKLRVVAVIAHEKVTQ